jgi:hypothetical protein
MARPTKANATKKNSSNSTIIRARSGLTIRRSGWSRRRQIKETGKKSYAYDPHLDPQWFGLGKRSGLRSNV